MGVRQAEALFLGFSRWGFDERGYSADTRRNYEHRARQADAALRSKGSNIFAAQLNDLRTYLFSTAPSVRNRNHIRAALVSFYDYLIDIDFRDDNPAQSLPRLKEMRKLPSTVPPGRVAALLRACRALSPMDRCLVSLFCFTGIRLNEMRMLEWERYEPPHFRFVSTKSSRERRMMLHPEAQLALDAWRARCDDARWVFPSPVRSGHPLSKATIQAHIREAGELVGISGLHPHQFRHSFAMELLDKSNGDIKLVQEALGHASISTTEIYLGMRPVRLNENLGKLSYEGSQW